MKEKMTKSRSTLRFLLSLTSTMLFLLGIVSGGYGVDQVGSNLLFGVIFLFLGAVFFYCGYRIAKLDVEYAVDSVKTGLFLNRMEVYFTLILAIVAGLILLTGTFTWVDSYLRMPKISYSYYFLMAFLWPVIGFETIVYILSVYSRYTLHLPFVGLLLNGTVLVLEISYLFVLSKLFVRLLGIKKREKKGG